MVVDGSIDARTFALWFDSPRKKRAPDSVSRSVVREGALEAAKGLGEWIGVQSVRHVLIEALAAGRPWLRRSASLTGPQIQMP